ncbi:hypothetical protein [Deinococcus navajonensis]|uniref:Uncharacterized protein n=1 Tax=Deinococcus navajonensis TaxID=309884 RepID=A0ABV8XNX2_9DEIO
MHWGLFLAWLAPFLAVGVWAGQAMDDLLLGLVLFGVLGALTGWFRARR